MTLWSLIRTDIAPLSIVELARCNEFSGSLLNRSGDAAQMADRRNEIQTTKNLADSDFRRASNFGGTEIASGESGLQTNFDNG